MKPAEKIELYSLVKLLTDGSAFVEHVQSERRPNENIKQTFERVTELIEEKTGLKHYASYQSFRVIKHRYQKRIGVGRNLQPTLFD